MSKVNVDEIKVGDLIGFDNYNKKIALGYVVEIKTPVVGVAQFWCHFSCKENPGQVGFLYDYNIDYHWKVINFEEESKMNELKVYTGKETIEALLIGKVLKANGLSYRLVDDLQVDFGEGKGWEESQIEVNSLLGFKATEVATPQVGDWVKVDSLGKYTHIAQVTRLEGNKMWADWESKGSESFYKVDSKGVSWQILSPEEVSEYKREQAFVKVGRKLNEFRVGDIVAVAVDSKGVYGVVVSKNSTHEVRVNEFNTPLKGYTAKPHQLTPISFVEQQVDLS